MEHLLGHLRRVEAELSVVPVREAQTEEDDLAGGEAESSGPLAARDEARQVALSRPQPLQVEGPERGRAPVLDPLRRQGPMPLSHERAGKSPRV